jgi:hypothetical protein
MTENEIKEFVSKTIEQVKAGLPEDCTLNGNFDFEVSVIVTKSTKGGINISLAEAGLSSNVQQAHKIRFSIIDKKSTKENLNQAMLTIRKFIDELKRTEKQK